MCQQNTGGSRRVHTHTRVQLLAPPQCVHLFAILLLVRGFLIVLFVGVESGRVNTVQALSPLPVESTEFPFAAERDCCLVTNQAHAVLELMLLYFYKPILQRNKYFISEDFCYSNASLSGSTPEHRYLNKHLQSMLKKKPYLLSCMQPSTLCNSLPKRPQGLKFNTHLSPVLQNKG